MVYICVFCVLFIFIILYCVVLFCLFFDSNGLLVYQKQSHWEQCSQIRTKKTHMVQSRPAPRV